MVKTYDDADFRTKYDFKRIYETYRSNGVDLSEPMSIDELMNVHKKLGLSNSSVNTALPTWFSEKNNFPADTDVGLYVHQNYLPAFLHAHEYYEIVYVLKGHCTNYFSEQRIDMEAGDILIILPGMNHAMSVFNDESKVINIVVRSSTFATSFLSVLQGHDILSSFFLYSQQGIGTFAYVLFATGNDERLEALIQSAYEEHCSDLPYKKRILNATLTLFFVELLRRHEKHIKFPFTYDGHQTIEAMSLLQYLYDNHKSISLKDLANHFNYSERNTARLLKKYTGQTYTQLVENMKLREASGLLSNSAFSIAEVAEISGYSSASQFYRTFKCKFNVSPSEYRKNHQAE